MIAKSSQSGPTERLLGNAAYTNPVASIAMIASQRGSLGVSGFVLELIRINISTRAFARQPHARSISKLAPLLQRKPVGICRERLNTPSEFRKALVSGSVLPG